MNKPMTYTEEQKSWDEMISYESNLNTFENYNRQLTLQEEQTGQQWLEENTTPSTSDYDAVMGQEPFNTFKGKLF